MSWFYFMFSPLGKRWPLWICSAEILKMPQYMKRQCCSFQTDEQGHPIFNFSGPLLGLVLTPVMSVMSQRRCATERRRQTYWLPYNRSHTLSNYRRQMFWVSLKMKLNSGRDLAVYTHNWNPSLSPPMHRWCMPYNYWITLILYNVYIKTCIGRQT